MNSWINLRINIKQKTVEAWEDGAKYKINFDKVDFSQLTVDSIIHEIKILNAKTNGNLKKKTCLMFKEE